MKNISRRDLLRYSALGLGVAVVSTGVETFAESELNNGENVAFLHGVASGDPLTDSVILWTRVTPQVEDVDQVAVTWEVATDADFVNLTHYGVMTATAASDFTVKLDVQNLNANSTYYYRFKSGGSYSPVGITKTLSEGSPEKIKFAVVTCSNYPSGHFNAYAEAAKIADLDAVLHLGDYIYEYGMGGFGTENAEAIGRALPDDNDEECLNLTDYRKRYALYRTDQDLQALHALAPFIAVWDDHEVADNTYTDGAANHNEGEGDFEQRKMAALQAYFEWMPVRPLVEGSDIIYRSFKFGDLVDLHMLDTRIIGRNQQLDYADFTDPTTGVFDFEGFTAALLDTNRTLLGAEQLQWLQGQLAASTAQWQVLGQQVLMSPILLPAELLLRIGSSPEDLVVLLAELSSIKIRMLQGDDSLTEQEIARVTTVLPLNLDAWDGYVYEREVVLATATSLGKKLVVLAGDSHNSWGSNLKDSAGNPVGVEFAVTSVSSPGLESVLSLDEDTARNIEAFLTLMVDDLQYTNVYQRGFMLVTFSADKASAEWVYVDNVDSRDYVIDESRGYTMALSRDIA
ncbi:MAG: alkaline phosphatase D family protein [Exilibacterium sp.]